MEDPCVPLRPIAAVLDTSAYNKGHFDAETVRELGQRLARRDAQLWIPSQVILEWAAHAHGAMDELRTGHARALSAGLVNSPKPPNLAVDAIVDKLNEQCSGMANVTVLDISGDAAVAGLRDQILGTGPGNVLGGTKISDVRFLGGVRTGASDSSWVRDALCKAGGDPTRIVFVTNNDKDVRATCRAIGHSRAKIRFWDGHNKDRFDKLFPPVEPQAEPRVDALAALKIITTMLLSDFAAAREADDYSGPPPEWIQVDGISVDAGLDPDDRRSIEDMIEPRAVMEPLAHLIDVRDVSVDADGEDTIVDYTVRLLADVRVEGRVFDNDGHTLMDWESLPTRVLAVPFSAKIRDGALHCIEQTDAADSWPAQRRFADAFDAFATLYNEEITQWDYITVKPIDTDAPEAGFVLHGPGGQVESATVDGWIGEDWELSFENSGVAINATYDPGSRVSAGRYDSFNAYPPVGLHSEGPGLRSYPPEPYSALAAVWAHLVTDAGEAPAADSQ
ncbi:hypothetical protein [Mycolicibacterium peregrinum]|uniref:hypothetical protein n=1 Tax=Mycolicibacterium peregrinum TaxID=43304 RepID=UPI003AADD0E3